MQYVRTVACCAECVWVCEWVSVMLFHCARLRFWHVVEVPVTSCSPAHVTVTLSYSILYFMVAVTHQLWLQHYFMVQYKHTTVASPGFHAHATISKLFRNRYVRSVIPVNQLLWVFLFIAMKGREWILEMTCDQNNSTSGAGAYCSWWICCICRAFRDARGKKCIARSDSTEAIQTTKSKRTDSISAL